MLRTFRTCRRGRSLGCGRTCAQLPERRSDWRTQKRPWVWQEYVDSNHARLVLETRHRPAVLLRSTSDCDTSRSCNENRPPPQRVAIRDRRHRSGLLRVGLGSSTLPTLTTQWSLKLQRGVIFAAELFEVFSAFFSHFLREHFHRSGHRVEVVSQPGIIRYSPQQVRGGGHAAIPWLAPPQAHSQL